MKKLFVASLLLIGTFALAQVAESEFKVQPKMVGETISKQNVTTDDESIYQAIKKQPTVLISFRGNWCPHCAKHLKEINTVAEKLNNLGYQIIAVSPDSQENTIKFQSKLNLSFRILSDANSSFLQDLGIVFQAPENYKRFLSKSSGGINTKPLLPVPAVFILDENQKIIHQHVTPNYKKRLRAKTLLAILGSLQ